MMTTCFGCRGALAADEAQTMNPTDGTAYHMTCAEAPVRTWVVRLDGSQPLTCDTEESARAEAASLEAEGGDATVEPGPTMTRAAFDGLGEHPGW